MQQFFKQLQRLQVANSRTAYYVSSHTQSTETQRSLFRQQLTRTQRGKQLERAVVANVAETVVDIPRIGSQPFRTRRLIAHQFVDGSLVRWCESNPSVSPPVAVMIHGIMGNMKNMQSMANRIAEEFPTWRVLLVDLRCHGESADDSTAFSAPHTVQSCGSDVLQLLSELKVFPHVVIGHSFGGKVALAMASQFGEVLPRPVHMWIWDSLPGNVRVQRQDHPEDVISALRGMTLPIPSRKFVSNYLQQRGFSEQISQWCTTNLRDFNVYGSGGGFVWNMDLMGIADLWQSYQKTNLWNVLAQPPQGLKLQFVRAERNYFKWDGGDADKIEEFGHPVHVLRNSGHFVHIDNPADLLQIIRPSFVSSDVNN
eukprot:TRINITY_DN5820_c0_g2_i1.p1 TRINITY_DN5820_c0_g2~~TRINITY_DN5820_c0_g2_i1.p1  ORF type:complete len:369 (+),score=54.49 TRINITY_DN5820_c0_g2_i1:156-1262(+)